MTLIILRRLSTLPKCDFKPHPYKHQSYEKLRNIRKSLISPAVFHYYKEPLLIHQGYKQWLFDEKNQRYLDMFGGIVTVGVGHCHPKINNALKYQMDKLWHTTNIYMHPQLHEYAEKLIAKFPDPLKVVYFVNSGSEANDAAFLMAKLYTGRNDIITLRNSYHGMSAFTMGATNLNTWRFNATTHSGFVPTMNPDPYRGIWGGKHCRDSPVQTTRKCNCVSGKCEASSKYCDQLADVLRYSTPKTGVAGFIAEGIQGVGGTVQFPRGFLTQAYNLIRQHGGVCISDEVQSGFGRLGSDFWGFQSHGVLPDIVTMAKSIGNGFPLGAVVTTREIANTLAEALTFNTYGGGPLQCAVGSAVLDVIDDEHLQANCDSVGTSFLLALKSKLLDKYDIVGDVRGKGLMIGVEMVNSKSTKEPLKIEKMNEIWEKTRELGVLFGKGGVYGNVFRIKPPMCITKEDANFAVDVLEEAISSVSL